ncbi:MAG: HAD family phosphatase [Phycisphaerae bacterium]|nr:HAD family phosphatase [Phycisphaerae bacterium]
MNNTPIEALIVDLGRVLVDIDVSLLTRDIFKNVSGDTEAQVMQTVMSDPVMLDFDTGVTTPQEFHQKLCERFALTFNYEEFTRLWCGLFSAKPDMDILISELARQYPMTLLSDVDILHWSHVRDTFPIVQKFTNPTLSFQTGYMKPAPECYRIAAENIKTPIEKCLFIDDLPKNVEGARQLGMHSLQFTNAEKLRNDLKNMGIL